MKAIILSIGTVVSVTVSAMAQIPNNSFETWMSMGTYSDPMDWDQLNAMTSSAGVYTAIKGTGGATNAGTSYLKLTSKTVTGMGVMPGVALSGIIDMATFKPKSGFANTQRPVSLSGSWQHMANGNDAGFAAVYLTKWNATMMMRDTIAIGLQSLTGMVMSWTMFNINLTYTSSATPDSAVIILSASGTTPVAGSYLYVDNLSFVGSVTGLNTISNYISSISAYPNPSTEKLTVTFNAIKNTTVQLHLMDLTGKLITEVNTDKSQGQHTAIISTKELAKGAYLLKIIANDAVETKKIIVE
ncbi:MAG: T9SS type A sorting domain-containing protein [Bacteroidia bacterium]|nr:T9SS type A sorting domain-containing protein [Bacteroidia bacterium]